jgi:hypothetical protein
MKRGLTTLLAASLLAGCAVLNTVHSDVSTFGDWPSGRAPGTYAFDRLPSQDSQPERAERIEAVARPALEMAGFVPAGPGRSPDVLVQVAVRSTRTESTIWADPLWWRGGYGFHRRPWPGTPWWPGPLMESQRYDREVAVLLRDSTTGKPLYEAHASNEGASGGDLALVSAMFQAALIDFPRNGPNPRNVATTLSP